MSQNIKRTCGVTPFLILFFIPIWGCFGTDLVDSSAATNEGPPIINESNLSVTCELEDLEGYEDYHWVFEAYVDDPDGFDDVSDVYVDVYLSSTLALLSSFTLSNQGNGNWDFGAYQSYNSLTIICGQKETYEYEFTAIDTWGETTMEVLRQ